MWFITEFLERQTRNFAKTVARVAAMEMEANRRALAEFRTRRAISQGLILPDRSLCVPLAIATEPRVLLLPDANGPARASAFAHLVEAQEARDADIALIETARPGDVLAAIAQVEAGDVLAAIAEADAGTHVPAAIPMGVRGDVVAKYIAAFAGTSGSDAGALIERLRKDKKVRVPELQLIAAAVIGEDTTIRRKAEHLDALRRQLVLPVDRRRSAVPEIGIHAG